MDTSIPKQRSARNAMARGFMGKCPACGTGKLFRKYLKVQDTCPDCGEELYHHQADDAPAYFTILIVGHILVPMALVVEQTWKPSIAFSIGLWIPAIIVSCLALLPRIKGALVGFQWSRRMHGFGGEK